MAERSLFCCISTLFTVSKAPNSTQGYSWLIIFTLKTVWFLTLKSYRTVYYLKNYTKSMACILSDDVCGRICTYSSKSQVRELQNHRTAWAGNELQLVSTSNPVPLQAFHVITGTACFPLCLFIGDALHQRDSGKTHKLHSCVSDNFGIASYAEHWTVTTVPIVTSDAFGPVPADLIYKWSVYSIIVWECILDSQSQGLMHLRILHIFLEIQDSVLKP